VVESDSIFLKYEELLAYIDVCVKLPMLFVTRLLPIVYERFHLNIFNQSS